MHAFLSNLTAAMLVIHAMIGCCHHHWHDADEVAAVSAASVACHCCHDSVPAGDEQLPGEQVPGEPCNGEFQCQGVCTYLPTQRTAVDASPLASSCEYAALPDAIATCGIVATALAWDSPDSCNASSPPPTLHSLHQLLLI